MPDKLSDAELNEQVARKLGWRRNGVDPYLWMRPPPAQSYDRTPGDLVGTDDLPRWSTSLDDVLQDLWPELREKGWEIGSNMFTPWFLRGMGKYVEYETDEQLARTIVEAWVEKRKGDKEGE